MKKMRPEPPRIITENYFTLSVNLANFIKTFLFLQNVEIKWFINERRPWFKL